MRRPTLTLALALLLLSGCASPTPTPDSPNSREAAFIDAMRDWHQRWQDATGQDDLGGPRNDVDWFDITGTGPLYLIREDLDRKVRAK